jgi:pimeloyl-ACP methyl ester carboxylesterase
MTNAAPTPKVPLALRGLFFVTLMVLGLLVMFRVLNQASVFPPVPKDAGLAPRLAMTTPNVREVRFAAEDGAPLYGWVQGRDDAPVKILQTMGNAEYVGPNADLYTETAEFLDAQFLLFDYRGFANSEGRPSEAGVYADIRGAYRFAVEELKWRPGQIVIWGRSLGGAPATRLCADLLAEPRREGLKAGGPPRALFLEAPFTSIPEMGKVAMPHLGVPQWLCYSMMDNLGRAPGLKLPVLHWHGDKDEIIPFTQGEQLHAALPGPKTFLRLEGVGHNNIWDDDARARRIRAAMRDFLAAHPEKH